MEKTLVESGERYRTLFQHMSDAVAIYKAVDEGNDFIFIDFNKAAEKIENISRDAVIGKSVTQIFPGVVEFGLLDVLKRVWKNGVPEQYPVQHYKDERISGWRENFIYKLPSGEIVAIYRDETERKQAEEDLKGSEERYRGLFDDALDMIHIVSKEGQIVDANPVELKTMGYSRDEYIGKPFLEIIHPDYQETVRKKMKEVLNGEKIQGNEIALVTKDGKKVHVEVNAVPQAVGRKIIAVRAIMRDITERKLTEIDKKRMRNRLLQAQKVEAIGTLAGGIAHDFNNILSIIFGYADMALTDIHKPEKLKKELNEINNAAVRAKELVYQILTFSRKAEMEKVPLKVFLIVKEALKLLRSSIPSTIEIKQSINSKETVVADTTQIHQIVVNFCTNAYYAMRDSGGILSIALNDIAITEDTIIPGLEIAPGKYVQLEVNDTGQGMDKETKEKIFDPYFTTKEVGDGTGLGLAVVHGIVKSHNGYINVYSESGKGTTFHVYLPVFEKKSVKQMSEDLGEPVGGGSEMIMFVDDEEKIVSIGYEVLTKYGYRVSNFQNGVEAFQEFKKDQKQFDLVITDMTMPQMDGLTLIKQIRKVKPQLPAILCSGYSELIDKEKLRELNINYIHKPIVMSQLVRTIRKVLDRVGI